MVKPQMSLSGMLETIHNAPWKDIGVYYVLAQETRGPEGPEALT